MALYAIYNENASPRKIERGPAENIPALEFVRERYTPEGSPFKYPRLRSIFVMKPKPSKPLAEEIRESLDPRTLESLQEAKKHITPGVSESLKDIRENTDGNDGITKIAGYIRKARKRCAAYRGLRPRCPRR